MLTGWCCQVDAAAAVAAAIAVARAGTGAGGRPRTGAGAGAGQLCCVPDVIHDFVCVSLPQFLLYLGGRCCRYCFGDC